MSIYSMDEVLHIGARDLLERELWEKYVSSNPIVPEIEKVLNICVDYARKVEELINDFLVTNEDMTDLRALLPQQTSPPTS